MGATYAVPELIVQGFQGELRIGFGVPQSWSAAEFENLPSRGGFVLTGRIERGKVTLLKVRAGRANTLRIRIAGEDTVIQLPMKRGEEVTLR